MLLRSTTLGAVIIKNVSHFILILLIPTGLFASQKSKNVKISFYSEVLSLDYFPSMQPNGLLLLDDLALVEYYQKLEGAEYQPLLDQLQQFSNQHKLNDWLYYELLKQATAKIYELDGPLKKEVSLWFLLTKSGFDTRLSYIDHEVYLYVWSEEDIFDTPMIVDEGRRFINLSSINQANESPEQLKLLLYRPGSDGHSFSFSLDELPILTPLVRQRSISFKVKERTFKMAIEVDSTIFEIMKNYPSIAEQAYFTVPMSKTTYNSLLPKLQFMVKDLSNREAIQVLVAFTRTAFDYKDDQEAFGRSRPMIPEELLHYPFSDCEDRAALFHYLVQEILGLPMLIIAYPDHLTVAVAEEEIEGLGIEYKGRRYFICDPTGPKESNIIGMPPLGYESTPFEILSPQ